MEEELISFKTAKLAKEKGFNIKTDKGYYEFINSPNDKKDNLLWTDALGGYEVKLNGYAPTQALLQKWLREEHDIHVNAHPIFNKKWSFSTYNVNNKSLLYSIGKGYIGEKFEGKTYEEALEKGLQEALTLIKKE